LKSWLLNTRPDEPRIKHTQDLVRELKGHSSSATNSNCFRPWRASAWTNTPSRFIEPLESKILVDWITRSDERQGSLLPTVIFLFILSTFNIICVLLSVYRVIPRIWPLIFVIYIGAMFMKQSRVATAWSDLFELEKALTHFKAVFAYLESRNYQNTPGLAEICSSFLEENRRPSLEMKRTGAFGCCVGSAHERASVAVGPCRGTVGFLFHLSSRVGQERDRAPAAALARCVVRTRSAELARKLRVPQPALCIS
jgi:hypothetical protein